MASTPKPSLLYAIHTSVGEYVGNPRLSVWVLAANAASLPNSAKMAYCPDQPEFDVAQVHQHLPHVTDGSSSAFAFYQGEVPEQYDGRPGETIIELERQWRATVKWDEALLQQFVRDGHLGDQDPPCLEATVEEAEWAENGTWNWSRTQWSPTSFQLLVGDDYGPPSYAFQSDMGEEPGFPEAILCAGHFV